MLWATLFCIGVTATMGMALLLAAFDADEQSNKEWLDDEEEER